MDFFTIWLFNCIDLFARRISNSFFLLSKVNYLFKAVRLLEFFYWLCIKNAYFRKNTLFPEKIFKRIWDMVNCSNCDCSKNLLDTILLLLDTIRANDKKSEKWSTIKKYLPYVYFEQFHF